MGLQMIITNGKKKQDILKSVSCHGSKKPHVNLDILTLISAIK
jgi:hypothetical protein